MLQGSSKYEKTDRKTQKNCEKKKGRIKKQKILENTKWNVRKAKKSIRWEKK